jgi:Mu-like prophage I protein
VNELIYVAKFSETDWIDGNKRWVQLYPYDTWSHPLYGDTTVDSNVAQKMVMNFNNKVRGQEIHSDYEHGQDSAKGNKASGRFVKVEARDDGLWSLVQFTDDAKKEIDAGEWNYWSTSHYDEWEHPQTKEKHQYVLDGGALTNKPWVKGMVPLNFSEFVMDVETIDEHSDLETHDPGMPPDPKTNEDDSAEGGWRRDTPPEGEDGTVPDRSKTVSNEGNNSEGGEMELEQQLREALNLDENADIIQAVTEMRDEVEPLREVAKRHAEKRRFSEEFPVEFDRMQRLEKDNRENFAKLFSETLADSRVMQKDGDNDKPTTVGLSSLAIEKGREMALKFSEGTASFDDFKEFTDAVFNNGLVDYGTIGSNQETDESIPEGDVRKFNEIPQSGTDARKLFAEAVLHYRDELVENDKLSSEDAYKQAINVAADKHPKLYEAYMAPVTAR